MNSDDKFWSKVDKSGDCWVWTGSKRSAGYGSFGKMGYAHRYAWKLTNGPIPNGMCICHHCDNPPCCNPDHLFLGTYSDNMKDMHAKGRWSRKTNNKTRKDKKRAKAMANQISVTLDEETQSRVDAYHERQSLLWGNISRNAIINRLIIEGLNRSEPQATKKKK